MTISQKRRQRRTHKGIAQQNMKHLLIGTLGGLILATALFAPMLVTIEPATPNGINVMFGDCCGYHVATTPKESK